MNWSFKQGWNEIAVYLFCVRDYAASILLGIPLTPVSFPLVSGNPLAFTDACYLEDDAGDPYQPITQIRAVRTRLQPVSRFDLEYNTPILYKRRYAADFDGTDTQLYLPSEPTARLVARYDEVEASRTQPASGVLTIDLSTQDVTMRPRIRGYSLLFE